MELSGRSSFNAAGVGSGSFMRIGSTQDLDSAWSSFYEVGYVLIGLIEQSLGVADEVGDSYRMLATVRDYMLFGVERRSSGRPGSTGESMGRTARGRTLADRLAPAYRLCGPWQRRARCEA